MKAPDKIYISHHYKQPIDYGFFKTENAEPYTVEYIRKDALVEWLQQGFDWIKNPVISVQQIIDKLNSM